MQYIFMNAYRFFCKRFFQDNALPLVSLTIAVIVIWYPITILDFSVTRFPIVDPGLSTFESSPGWPVQDSYASATQDEPWMVLIGRSLRQGALPVVNTFNGLGAPLSESMQSGVWYPLNVIVPFLPLSKPLSFDLFMMLHVIIFSYGLYALYRLFMGPWKAAAIALLIAGSGVVFLNVNMVHFRSLTWFPWILATSFLIIKTNRYVWPVPAGIIFFVLHLTAGSLQDSVITACLGLFLTLTYGYVCYREYFWQRLKVYIGMCFSGITIGSIGFISFLAAQFSDLLFVTDGPVRSLQSVNWYYMASWVIPKFKGIYPYFIMSGTDQQNQPDLPTSLFFFLCVGVGIAGFYTIQRYRGSHDSREGVHGHWMLLLCCLVVFGLLKTAHISLFDFFQYIPFIESLKFAKYNLWIPVVVGLIAGWGIEELQNVQKEVRRAVIIAAFLLALGLIGALFFVAFRHEHTINQAVFLSFPKIIQQEIAIAYSVNILGFLLCTLVLLSRRLSDSFRPILLFCIIACVSISAMPFGWYERSVTWVPSNQVLLVHEMGERVMSFISDTEDRPRLLLGAPHSNRSLLLNEETISVWDPVLNKAYQEFMTTHFDIDVPELLLQPSKDTALDQKAITALQFLGVDAVQGYAIDSAVLSDDIQKDLIRNQEVFFIKNSLPRAFFLTDQQYTAVQQRYQQDPKNLQVIIDMIHSANTENAISNAFVDITAIHTNSIDLQYHAQQPGHIILAQAFTSAWKRNGVDEGVAFAGLYPSWPVSTMNDEGSVDITVSYQLPGASLMVLFVILGSVVSFMTILYAYTQRAKMYE